MFVLYITRAKCLSRKKFTNYYKCLVYHAIFSHKAIFYKFLGNLLAENGVISLIMGKFSFKFFFFDLQWVFFYG